MPLVAGIDSSTQSCKVVVRDADTGALVRSGRASHPEGTEVHPNAWWEALAEAINDAGGLEDVAAISVAGQQHGMVVLDEHGEVIRPALLWNDTRSAPAATELISELGDGDEEAGKSAWVNAVGSVPVASLTATKLRWLRDAEPTNAAKVAAVALPHDWLTWRLMGGGPGRDLNTLVTDRSDASGTAYWSPFTNDYRRDLLEMALGHDAILPRVLGPNQAAGRTVAALPGLPAGLLIGPGAGDNAAAALALGMRSGDVTFSIGTSGVVSAVTDTPVADTSGLVAGFADATGNYLPLAVTLNAARILDATAQILGVDHAGLSGLALTAPAGCDGLVLVPYFEGERTPNKPDATGAFHGLQLKNATPAHFARAAIEGVFASLADGLDAILSQGFTAERVLLIGGAANSPAVRAIAPAVLGLEVLAPSPGEYVADGAARQAAWVLSGADQPPVWPDAGQTSQSESHTPQVRARYGEARDLTINKLG